MNFLLVNGQASDLVDEIPGLVLEILLRVTVTTLDLSTGLISYPFGLKTLVVHSLTSSGLSDAVS